MNNPSTSAERTLGQVLVSMLEQRGVDTVFGIPGVHTIELYRGLSGAGIRHVTPPHEQGAGFMADGYSRAGDKPGVAFVITGPGLTNALTPMAQARADSVAMLVIAAVNPTRTAGRGAGHLHELPDQLAAAAAIAVQAHHVESAVQAEQALSAAFDLFSNGRPGPVFVEVALDRLGMVANDHPWPEPSAADLADLFGESDGAIAAATSMLTKAERPVLLVGGGARRADAEVEALAVLLDAPVVQTVNARGLLFDHPLCVPVSPSLPAVRNLLADADCTLAIGTEFGPTDYDVYEDGLGALPDPLIHVDIDGRQLGRIDAAVQFRGDAVHVLGELSQAVRTSRSATESDTAPQPALEPTAGEQRAAAARDRGRAELSSGYELLVQTVEALRAVLPGSIIVGDSTQLVYAANLWYAHDRPGGYFNSATGYGALGYGIPAAIGAALADPQSRVVCLIGDGGAQFTLPELGAAVDEGVDVVFVVWNNHGYGEIASAMASAGVDVIGCDPTPPDFEFVARSVAMPFVRCVVSADAAGVLAVAEAVRVAVATHPKGPLLVEVDAPDW